MLAVPKLKISRSPCIPLNGNYLFKSDELDICWYTSTNLSIISPMKHLNAFLVAESRIIHSLSATPNNIPFAKTQIALISFTLRCIFLFSDASGSLYRIFSFPQKAHLMRRTKTNQTVVEPDVLVAMLTVIRRVPVPGLCTLQDKILCMQLYSDKNIFVTTVFAESADPDKKKNHHYPSYDVGIVNDHLKESAQLNRKCVAREMVNNTLRSVL